MGVSAAIAKAELHDLHAGNLQLFPQFGHLVRDVAEIFGEKGQLAQRASQRLEQVLVRAFYPMTMHRGRLIGGNFPAGFETTEVIDAHDVTGLDRPAHALDPPVVAARLEYIPVVERVAPTLSRLAERIRGNTGNDLGRQVILQAKDFGVDPHVSAVVADEDGNVADDADAALAAVGAESAPLLKEGELQKALHFELLVQFRMQLRDGVGMTMNYVLRPTVPWLLAEAVTQRAEQHVVFEPPMVLLAELFVAFSTCSRRRSQKVGGGLEQQRQFLGADVLEINR